MSGRINKVAPFSSQKKIRTPPILTTQTTMTPAIQANIFIFRTMTSSNQQRRYLRWRRRRDSSAGSGVGVRPGRVIIIGRANMHRLMMSINSKMTNFLGAKSAKTIAILTYSRLKKNTNFADRLLSRGKEARLFKQ